MNFRDEYKREIEETLPDNETAERIRRAVEQELSQPSVQLKKPFPLRRIAIVGATAAACLVIGVTALITISGNGLFFGSDEKIFNNAPNMATGSAAPSANIGGGSNGGEPQGSIGETAAGGSFNGGNDMVQGDAVMDSGKTDGGIHNAENFDGAPAANESEPQATENYWSSKADDTESASNEGSGILGRPADPLLITFDGDGFTLTYEGTERRYIQSSYDSAKDDVTVSLIPHENSAENCAEAVTDDGDRYMIRFSENGVLLLSNEFEVLGVYVSAD